MPVQTVDSVNLIGIAEDTLRGWLAKNVTPDVVDNCVGAMDEIALLANASLDQEGLNEKNLIIEAIVKNVASMNETSTPISGAPSRSEMPQTDNVDWMAPLEDGEIDIEEPHASSDSVQAERRTRSGDIFVERWQKLAGILKD